MANIGVAELRGVMADVLNRVAYQGERVILERRGKGVAAIVSIDDLKLLEELEDKADVRAARRVLREMERTGEKPIPWEEIKREWDAEKEQRT